MSWQNRTRQAAYVSPSGARFLFDYTKADREFDKNTSDYNFPGVPGTYVQDLGSTDRRYPMRVIFWGSDHDLKAKAFENALRETGRGRLEHPRDGRVDVIPFGTVKSREDLVRDANQTIIDVEFWESTIVLYPSGASDPGGQVLSSVSDTLEASSSTFAGNIDIASAIDRASLRNRFGTAVGAVRSVLGAVVSSDTDQLREFNIVADSMISDLDELITTPAVLADQLNVLMQIPANANVPISTKFEGFTEVISQFTSEANPDNALRATVNDFRNDELFAVGAMASLVTSSINATFSTRSEAVTAAADITTQFGQVNQWRETNYAGIV